MVSGPENNRESTLGRALDLLQDIEELSFFFEKKITRLSTLRTRRGNPFRRLCKSYEVNVNVLKLTKEGFVSKLDFP